MGIVHSCILNVLPNASLVAVCEKNRFTRRLMTKIFRGAKVVDDVTRLSDSNLDAVYITTPIPSHFSVAKALLDNRVAQSIFVEKTLASNHDQAKKLCELMKNVNGSNMVGYLRRFHVTFKKAKELLSQGAIGAPLSFRAYGYSSDLLGVEEQSAGLAARGGVLRDLGCHVLDLALWFFGDLQVSCAKTRSIVTTDSEDYVDVKVGNKLCPEGQITVSWCMENYRMPEVGFTVVGSEGTMEVNDDKLSLKMREGKPAQWFRHDLNDNVPFWLALPEYYREDHHFVDSVRQHRPCEPDFQAASLTDKIIQEIEEEAAESE